MPFCDINTDVKPWLGIDVIETKHDTVLTILRDSVEQSVINYTEQTFGLVVEPGEILDGNMSDAIAPKHTPIVSVESIHLGVDGDGNGGQLLSTSQYQVHAEGITLIGTFTNNYRSSIKIAYTYGYNGVPADVKQAILLGVEAEFRRKGRKSIGTTGRSKKDETESFSGGSSSWDKKSGLPKEVVFKLNPYRTFEFPTQPRAVHNR